MHGRVCSTQAEAWDCARTAEARDVPPASARRGPPVAANPMMWWAGGWADSR
jgi:hypothetical protein